MNALSCIICIVGSFALMSVSRLHLFRFIWTSGSCNDLCIYLVSLNVFGRSFVQFYFDNVYVVSGKIALIVLGYAQLCYERYVGILCLYSSTLYSCDYRVVSICICMI